MLIRNVETWFSRKHGDVDFYSTQFRSDHGCFREYLYKYGHEEVAMCSFCGSERENAEHIFFHCPKYETYRINLETQITGNNARKYSATHVAVTAGMCS